MSINILHDGDASLDALNNRVIAVIGFGAQGRAQALCLRDSGANVIIGIRPGKSFDAAVQEESPAEDCLFHDSYHDSVYGIYGILPVG